MDRRDARVKEKKLFHLSCVCYTSCWFLVCITVDRNNYLGDNLLLPWLVSQVQNNLCTPKNGEILVASTQDFLTSSFLITRKDTFYDRAAFSLICSYMGDGMDAIDLPTPTIVKV